MAEKEKVKIAYATRPVEVTDEQGNKTVVYKKYHPVTTGNAVVVGGKTLANKLQEIAGYIAGKVDKVSGKGLSTEDFTTLLKTKLEGLSNYDDTEVRGLITTLNNALDTLTGTADTTDVIDTMNEIVAFLDNYKNTDSLASVLSTLESTIHSWVEGKKYLTTHQDISGKENTSNKVSAWSSTTTDTHYPSEKLVKTALDAKQNTINASNKLAASNLSGLATVATSGSYNDLTNKPTIPTVPSSLPANGGNADTVDGYHFVVGSAGTAANTIYFVV